MNLAESTSLMDSVNLTIIGMVVVLVFVMKVLGWLVEVLEKYFPQSAPAPAAAAARADNLAIAAAVAAAKRFTGK